MFLHVLLIATYAVLSPHAMTTDEFVRLEASDMYSKTVKKIFEDFDEVAKLNYEYSELERKTVDAVDKYETLKAAHGVSDRRTQRAGEKAAWDYGALIYSAKSIVNIAKNILKNYQQKIENLPEDIANGATEEVKDMHEFARTLMRDLPEFIERGESIIVDLKSKQHEIFSEISARD